MALLAASLGLASSFISPVLDPRWTNPHSSSTPRIIFANFPLLCIFALN